MIFHVNPVTTTTFYDDNTDSSFNSYRLYVDHSVVSILQVEVAVKSEIEHCCYCIYRNIRCLTFGAEYHKTIRHDTNLSQTFSYGIYHMNYELDIYL